MLRNKAVLEAKISLGSDKGVSEEDVSLETYEDVLAEHIPLKNDEKKVGTVLRRVGWGGG